MSAGIAFCAMVGLLGQTTTVSVSTGVLEASIRLDDFAVEPSGSTAAGASAPSGAPTLIIPLLLDKSAPLKGLSNLSTTNIEFKLKSGSVTVSSASQFVNIQNKRYKLAVRRLAWRTMPADGVCPAPLDWKQQPTQYSPKRTEAPPDQCLYSCSNDGCELLAMTSSPQITFGRELRSNIDAAQSDSEKKQLIQAGKETIAISLKTLTFSYSGGNNPQVVWSAPEDAPPPVTGERVEYFLPGAVRSVVPVDDKQLDIQTYQLKLSEQMRSLSCIAVPRSWDRTLPSPLPKLTAGGAEITNIEWSGTLKGFCPALATEKTDEWLKNIKGRAATHGSPFEIAVSWNDQTVLTISFQPDIKFESGYIGDKDYKPIKSFSSIEPTTSWIESICIKSPDISQGGDQRLPVSELSIVDELGYKVVEFSGDAYFEIREESLCAKVVLASQGNDGPLRGVLLSNFGGDRALRLYYRGIPIGDPVSPDYNFFYDIRRVERTAYASTGLWKPIFRIGNTPESLFIVRAHLPIVGVGFGFPKFGGRLELGASTGTLLGSGAPSTSGSTATVGVSLGLYAGGCLRFPIAPISRICGTLAGDGMYLSAESASASLSWQITVGNN